jgi:hypothetical protein
MTNTSLEHLPNDVVTSIQKIYIPAGLKITQPPLREPCGFEYGACRFGLGDQTIVFRIAKTTPKKIGQFTTLWKRPTQSRDIAPLDTTDNVAFVVVCVSDGVSHGQFVFCQKILFEKNIMSQDTKKGKCAFRLYPPWTHPTSRRALKTQQWQSPYFFSQGKDGSANLEEVRRLFKQSNPS